MLHFTAISVCVCAYLCKLPLEARVPTARIGFRRTLALSVVRGDGFRDMAAIRFDASTPLTRTTHFGCLQH